MTKNELFPNQIGEKLTVQEPVTTHLKYSQTKKKNNPSLLLLLLGETPMKKQSCNKLQRQFPHPQTSNPETSSQIFLWPLPHKLPPKLLGPLPYPPPPWPVRPLEEQDHREEVEDRVHPTL